MTLISRRNVLAGLAASSAAFVVTAHGEERQDGASTHARLVPGERGENANALRSYFSANAPKLLRAAGGVLKYPSVAPGLPGKQYSAQLWDWDTLWTSRGLFRVAELEHDEALNRLSRP